MNERRVFVLLFLVLLFSPTLVLPLPQLLVGVAVEFLLLAAVALSMASPIRRALEYAAIMVSIPTILSIILNLLALDSFAFSVPLLLAAELLAFGGAPIQYLRYDSLDVPFIQLTYMYNREVRYYRGLYTLSNFLRASFFALWIISLALATTPAGLVMFLLASLVGSLLILRSMTSLLRERPLFRVGE